MSDLPLSLSRATDNDADMAVILRLIKEAADWLRTQGTDQWARPWPNRAGRDRMIRAALREGKTWICRDNGTAVATITPDPAEDPYWSREQRGEPAVYIHRLVVSRQYAGAGLGAALLDWAGRAARREHGAKWIRVSAWTTNKRLHDYYLAQGFSLCALDPDDGYPSAAHFQKATADIPPVRFPLFPHT